MVLRYAFWLCILLSQLSVYAQQEDYFVVVKGDSLKPTKISSGQCSRFLAAATKRTNKLEKQIKKANDYYICAFANVEQQLLEQLCLKNEASANALIEDSWYRNNRFNNKCRREQNEKPNKYYPEMDSLSRAVSRLELLVNRELKAGEKAEGKCGCKGADGFKKARQSLSKEIKKSELISQYFKEQNEALTNTFQGSPELSSLLKPMQSTQAYFGLQLKELQSLFGDRSFLEKKLMSALMSSMGGSVLPSSSASNLSQELKPLELNDLLKNSSDLTKVKVELIKENPELVKAFKYQEDASKLKEYLSASDSLTKKLAPDSLSILSGLDTITVNQEKTDTLAREAKKKHKDEDAINPLKVKRWRDRLSLTNSFQPDQGTSFLPRGFAFNSTLMYQWQKKSNVGIGGNYFNSIVPINSNLGESHVWNNRVVNGGFGYKSSIDLQLKSFLFLQGNYEVNYRNIALNSKGIEHELERMNACLLGVKLVYGTGLRKSTSEILYNFNHQSGQPAIVFRTGVQLVSKHRYLPK